jgi:AraC-like DNA-binding protein
MTRGFPNVKFASDIAGWSASATITSAVLSSRPPGLGHSTIIQRRLECAKTLLRRTNQPLALIAQEAGFADQSHPTSISKPPFAARDFGRP